MSKSNKITKLDTLLAGQHVPKVEAIKKPIQYTKPRSINYTTQPRAQNPSYYDIAKELGHVYKKKANKDV